MNKKEFFKLDKDIDKSINYLIIAPIFMLIYALSANYLVRLVAEKLKINENIVFWLFMGLFLLILFIICFIGLKKYMNSMSERENWVITNEEALIKEEGIIHKYEIIDITYLQNTLSDKINTKKTRLFKNETDLVEVVYLKNGQKYKLITEAAVLSEKPKYITYIEFDAEGTFYRNGFYNLICQ